MNILQEGSVRKFLRQVQQVTFAGKYVKPGQEILYVTERCVFRLVPEGVMLTEIAPGMDLQRDILDKMDFTPLVSPDLKRMDGRIFLPGRMGCFD